MVFGNSYIILVNPPIIFLVLSLAVAKREIGTGSGVDRNLLFREDSCATKLLSLFHRFVLFPGFLSRAKFSLNNSHSLSDFGSNFQDEVILIFWKTFLNHSLDTLNFDSLESPEPTTPKKKKSAQSAIIAAFDQILNHFGQLPMRIPPLFKSLCSRLCSLVSAQYGEEGKVNFLIGYFFLHFLIPCIARPPSLIDSVKVPPTFQIFCLIGSKVLHFAAIGRKFENGDQQMYLNDTIDKFSKPIQTILGALEESSSGDDLSDPKTILFREVNGKVEPEDDQNEKAEEEDVFLVDQNTVHFLVLFFSQYGPLIRQNLKSNISGPQLYSSLETLSSLQIRLDTLSLRIAKSGQKEEEEEEEEGRSESPSKNQTEYVSPFEHLQPSNQEGSGLNFSKNLKSSSHRLFLSLNESLRFQSSREDKIKRKEENKNEEQKDSFENEKVVTMSLEEILGDENIRRVFYSFLKRNFMGETLELWFFLEELANIVDEIEWQQKFIQVCHEFLLHSRSPRFVHLDGCENDIQAAYRSVLLSNEISFFDEESRGLVQQPQRFSFFSSSSSFSSPSSAQVMSFSSSLNSKSLEPLVTKMRKRVWGMMMTSCVPIFLLSDEYQLFINEVVDSSKNAFSRSKAQAFFGETIEGKLRRREIVFEKKQTNHHRRFSSRQRFSVVGGRK